MMQRKAPRGYLQEHMYNFAIKHPGWHSIASKGTQTKRVAKSLHKKGLIELIEYDDRSMQFRA